MLPSSELALEKGAKGSRAYGKLLGFVLFTVFCECGVAPTALAWEENPF